MVNFFTSAPLISTTCAASYVKHALWQPFFAKNVFNHHFLNYPDGATVSILCQKN
jgi:hypothetical protein